VILGAALALPSINSRQRFRSFTIRHFTPLHIGDRILTLHAFPQRSLHHLRVIRSSPSPPRKVEFGTAITTADESIVSSAGEAIDRETEIKEDTPTGEEKGKRRADIDAVAKFEEREAKKRMVLSSGKCWGTEPAIHNAGKEAENGSRGTG
jgi:hypothetical protein